MQRINYFLQIIVAGFSAVMLCCLIMGHSTLAAQKGVSVTAMPAILDLGGDPGEELPFSFVLRNNSETVAAVRLNARDSRARSGQTEELMRSLSAKDWITFQIKDFLIQPHEEQEVTGTVRIPNESGPGGRYSDIAIQLLGSVSEQDILISSQPELVIQMLLTVTGEISEELTIEAAGQKTLFLDRSGATTISTFSILNEGNIHTSFTPTLHMKNAKNSIADDADSEILLPGEKRVVSFAIPDSAQLRLYKTHLSVTYGHNLEETSPEINVFILPFNPKLLLLGLCLPLIAYGFMRRERVGRAIKILKSGDYML
jgi:hypothetical protein